MKFNPAHGCPTFYSSWVKFSCVSLSMAAIAAVIKAMFDVLMGVSSKIFVPKTNVL